MQRNRSDLRARTQAFILTLAAAVALWMPLPARGQASEDTCRPRASQIVNVNTASAAELTRLPRIGPARAQAIVRMRARLGGFKRPSQLLRVKGIGRATLRGLLPHVRLVDPPAGAREGAGAPDPVP